MFWVVLGFAVLQLILFVFLVPETLWNEDETPISMSNVSSNLLATTETHGKQVVEHVQLENGQQRNIRSGRVGAAWMPWKRPGEFAKIFMSPILMVSLSVVPPLVWVV
jgi:hypothetical protein